MRSPADIERKRGPAEHRHRVVPGMTRAKLYQDFAARGYRIGAEIGVADGRNALTICSAFSRLSLFCVDPWLRYSDNPRGGPQEQHDTNYALAKARLAPYGAILCRSMSVDAAHTIESLKIELDFVYIDGHHGKSHVAEDLYFWSRLVRSGGAVSGHDFYHFREAGVVEAVVDHTEKHGITDWQLCDESEPSFWWTKK